MGELVTFYLAAGAMILSALAVIWAKSPVYSLLSLLVTMCCLAVLFVLLGAVFLAALQLLIYAGAILVLFLFVFMLLKLDPATIARARQCAGRWPALLLGGWLLFQLGWILRAVLARGASAQAPVSGTIATVGGAIFHAALLPFELTSLLILAAIIGAVALAQRKHE